MELKNSVAEFVDKNPLSKVWVFYFFYDAIVKSLPRYLGLYYKHTLLLSPHQVAVLLSSRYFALLFGSPLLGFIADKTNRFKNVLIVTLLAMLATYIMVPLVEPINGFHCMEHVHNMSYSNTSNTTKGLVKQAFLVKVHQYNSEILNGPNGPQYHGNLMYDLYYTWPFNTFEYEATDSITYKVFVVLLIISVVGEFFASPGETFSDLYTLQVLGNDSIKFGRQIIPGAIGLYIVSIIFSLVTNMDLNLKDDFCHLGHVINYSPYLYVVYGMICVCILVAFFFKYTSYARMSVVKKQKEDQKCNCTLFEALCVLVKCPAYFAFAVGVVFSGIGAGIKQLYIYHYISELGGPLYLMPLITTTHFVSYMVSLIFSPMLIQKYGQINIIWVGLLTHGFTFVIYSVIESPWFVFLVEPFEGVSMLSWVAIATYVGSPPGIGAALQGLIHGLYRGLGIAIGFLAVSVLILKYGYQVFFIGVGLVYFVVFGFYVSIMYFYPKKKSIAEEYGNLYVLLNSSGGDDDGDDDSEHIDAIKRQTKKGNSYDKEMLDTSFLD